MNFSDLIPYSQAAFSPDGQQLAIAKQGEVHVFDCEDLSVITKFYLKDNISMLEFSPDGAFLMMVSSKTNCAHFRCVKPEGVLPPGLEASSWQGKIDEGMVGLAAAIWAPCSRQVLVYSEMMLRVTAWSFVEQAPLAIFRNPKVLAPKGISFTQNKSFVALLERRDQKDAISIYFTNANWKMINTFDSAETMDAVDIAWTKSDTAIVVQETSLECKLVVYSALSGDTLIKHAPYN